jgi:hypothetical protein
MNLKQLFCNHVWKIDKEEFLRDTREVFGLAFGKLDTYADYKYYAQYQHCLNCSKTRIIETRKIII